MNILIFIAGLALTTLVVADLILTSFGFDSKSPISNPYRAYFWRLLLFLSGGRGAATLLKFAGPLTVIFWLVGWFILVWIGNSLIVLADASSVVESGTLHSTGFWAKVYFVGYTLSTLGSGEYIPRGTGWQLYSAFISFSGFMLITIAITYLLQVISSEADKRSLASQLHCLGDTPEQLIKSLYANDGGQHLAEQLSGFTGDIHSLSHKHTAYPILHNFHSTDKHSNLEINLVRLDEALTLFYLSKQCSPETKRTLIPLRNAITYFLSTLESAFIAKAGQPPPAPAESSLTNLNPNTNGYQNANITERRKLLAGWLNNQGWKWNDIFEDSSQVLDFWEASKSKPS